MKKILSSSRIALVSVYDKTNIVEFAKQLVDNGYDIISTGGTYNLLKSNDDLASHVLQIIDYTESPEILVGRVKTIHPKIHAALLADRDNEEHRKQLNEFDILDIQLVVVNLYPLQETLLKTDDLDEIFENTDIGGHSIIRAACKNYKHITTITSKDDYNINMYSLNNLDVRKRLMIKALHYIARYDIALINYLDQDHMYRHYKRESNLKYGCNPQQDASLWTSASQKNPFSINPYTLLNGIPGYINYLDAINGWKLVSEASSSLNTICAASFKHVSPAGVAVYQYDVTGYYRKMYNSNINSKTALTYLRARDCDPKSSFGDFIAISHPVDVETANVIKRFVSDGIIAPDYDPEALEILKQKKKGKFIIFKVEKEDTLVKSVSFGDIPSGNYMRDIGGITLCQTGNNKETTISTITDSIVTSNKKLHDINIDDLILANITTKYTQSNSIVYCFWGQTIGIGAGQQSRVDCVKLAGEKAKMFFQRHGLIDSDQFKFESNVKLQDRINDIILYIEAKQMIDPSFGSDYGVDEVSMSSDAFFPYRDNIDYAYRYGVKYIVQPGGSIQDQTIIDTCNKYNMVMCNTGIRLFHH